MITAKISEVSIQMNCFPLLQSQSNIDEGSVEWTEAYMLAQPISTMTTQQATSHQSTVFARLLFLYPPASLIS